VKENVPEGEGQEKGWTTKDEDSGRERGSRKKKVKRGGFMEVL
jgi:hypothetical protein